MASLETTKTNRRMAFTTVVTGLIIVAIAVTMISAQTTSRNVSLALVGATIYPSPTDVPIRSGVVLVQDGRIAALGPRTQVKIPPGTEVLDCAGRTIAAGFWNSHVHFMETKWADAARIPASDLDQQLQDMLTRYGFTAAFDLSSPWENTRLLRDRIESREVAGPRIYTTGLGLLPANPGVPAEAALYMGWMNIMGPQVADAAQAVAASRKLLNDGVDGIKVFVSTPSKASFSQAIIEAVVREAHNAGKPVFIHPNTSADVVTALRAGVDVIAHTTPQSGSWDDTLLATAGEHQAALTPTLWIWKWYSRHGRRSAQDKVVDAEVGQLRAWIAKGGTVLFGTDLGAVDPDPAEEYQLMTQAGMDFRHILASLTTAPAERFGRSRELGRVAVGFKADLVVLKGDPSRNVQALTDVQYTLRDGKIIYRTAK
jgi:imidazolonepropionase-like amidohydrolase